MQHLENDMDDLFQRAAENYPLKTEKDDWESVAKRLAVKDDPRVAIAPVKSKKNKKIIFFFMLLFMMLAGGFMYRMFREGTATPKHAIDFTKDNNNQTNNRTSNDDANNITDQHDRGLSPSMQKANQNKKTSLFQNTFSKNTKPPTSNARFYSGRKVNTVKENASPTITLNENSNNSSDLSSDESLNRKNNNDTVENLKNSNKEITRSLKTENEKQDILKRENKESGTATKIDKKNNVIQRRKGLYIGVSTGLDFSKVESASFSNTGFDAGLLLGYRLNEALSFETGLLWNKKYYNSDGKYFSMDKIRSSMPSGMIIDNLEGQSSLIEIPIKAKFDFDRKVNSNLFFTGGVSSYIMTKEKNMYNATVNGNQEKVSGVYGKNNYRFPTVVNLSLGYEHNISRTLNIRIEPFLKIPLQGIGVGNLPVTSAGIQIGITGHLK